MIRIFIILIVVFSQCGESATRVFYDNFDDGTISTPTYSVDGSSWSNGNATPCIAKGPTGFDGTAPKSGSYAMACNWDGSNAQAVNDTELLSGIPGGDESEFLVRWWQRFDNDKDFKDGAKGWRFNDLPGADYIYCQTDPVSTSSTRCILTVSGTLRIQNYGITFHDHQWHKVEFYTLKSPTNGIYKLWIDDQLVYPMDTQGPFLGPTQNSTGGTWFPFFYTSNWTNNTGWEHDAINHQYMDDFEIYSNSTAGQTATGTMSNGDIAVGGTPDTTPPTDPTNLVATAGSTNIITLAWTASTDNVGVSGYSVERCTGPGCSNFSQINTTATNSYSDIGLIANTTYVYRVRAFDGSGNNSGYSNTSNATTPNTFNIGEINILGGDDFGNTGLVLAQSAVAPNSGTLTNLSFYVTTAAGQMRLGVYSNSSNNPGTKLAETAEFTPTTGWNTQNLVSNIPIVSGTTYWLAYAYNNNALHFRNISSGTIAFSNFSYGVLPSTFPTPITNQTFHWSYYGIATLGSTSLSAPINLSVTVQ